MNREEIEKLEAGQELDTWIAKLMNWQPVEKAKGYWQDAGGQLYRVGDAPVYRMPHKHFAPSTEFAHVWQLVEEMRARWRTPDQEELYWQFVDCQEYGWRVEIMYSHHDGDFPIECAAADTFPLAVCRAALKTVAQEVEA